MPRDADRKKRIRETMRTDGVPYTEAARRLDAATPATADTATPATADTATQHTNVPFRLTSGYPNQDDPNETFLGALNREFIRTARRFGYPTGGATLTDAFPAGLPAVLLPDLLQMEAAPSPEASGELAGRLLATHRIRDAALLNGPRNHTGAPAVVLVTPTGPWDTRTAPHSLVTGPDRYTHTAAVTRTALDAGWIVLTDPAAANDALAARYAFLSLTGNPASTGTPVLLTADTDQVDPDALIDLLRRGGTAGIHVLAVARTAGDVPAAVSDQTVLLTGNT